MKNGIEIAISTYNRAPILGRWLDICLPQIKRIGIALAVYDSSTNIETEELVQSYNGVDEYNIKYVRVSNNTTVDDKVLMSIMETEYTYVWPLGDSRSLDFEAVEEKVIPFYKNNFDFMCIWSEGEKNKDGKTYIDPVDFFDDCFWHTTWMGGIVFKRTIFDPLNDDITKEYFIKKYNKEDAFNYLGIFYDLIANKDIKGSFSIVKITELAPNKTPGWLSRYMEVWCGNLCYLVDSVDDSYNSVKLKALRTTWYILRLDGPGWCYKARKKGGLSKDILDYYEELGYLDRVTLNKDKMMTYATASELKMLLIVFVTKAKNFCNKVWNYIVNKRHAMEV